MSPQQRWSAPQHSQSPLDQRFHTTISFSIVTQDQGYLQWERLTGLSERLVLFTGRPCSMAGSCV
jgi:hypothetical protein